MSFTRLHLDSMLQFEQILPFPLANFTHGEQSIWGRNFALNPKEKTLLNASSGKGKTTFIALIFGLRKDYNGRASWNGTDLRDFSSDDWTELRRKTFSVVFQDLQLLPQLTLEENLKIKHDLGSDLSFDEVLNWIDAMGLGDKLKQKAGTLSFGQQQRVAIARALIPEFQYLLLDEPFSHLDAHNSAVALNLILTRCDKLNSGCLLTTLGDTYNNQFDNLLHL